jgi:hypothetical protein
MHARTRVIMHCRTLSRVARRLPMVWQTSKCVGEVSFHFRCGADYTRILMCSPTQKSDRTGIYFWVYNSIKFKNHQFPYTWCLFELFFFLFWCGEFNPEVNPRILDYKVCSPTGDMEICLLWMLRGVQLEATATGRALDHESLPNVCHWVRLGGTISL